MSFEVSLATAIMLKLVTELVLRVTKAVVARLRAASTTEAPPRSSRVRYNHSNL